MPFSSAFVGGQQQQQSPLGGSLPFHRNQQQRDFSAPYSDVFPFALGSSSFSASTPRSSSASWRHSPNYSSSKPPPTTTTLDDVDSRRSPSLAEAGAWYKSMSRILKRKRRKQQASSILPMHVFCDLDGVLVDFEHGIRQVFPDVQAGVQINDLHRPTMWQTVAAQGAFFETLPWTSEGKRLWEAIRPLQPDILTGVPGSYQESRIQKVKWCQRELGVSVVSHVDMAGHFFQHVPVNSHGQQQQQQQQQQRMEQKHGQGGVDVDDEHDEPVVMNVITCWSNNKHHESGPGRVLIDDCKRLGDDWERKGGIFIHHQGNVDATIDQLYTHGVIRES